MVVVTAVPSPWSEAAKHLFHLAGVETLWVRADHRNEALAAWTRAHNQPVVFHDDDPPRTGWAEIVALAARLAKAPVVPTSASGRVRTFGLLNELAGEDGLGWCTRLLMIDESFRHEGAQGLPLPVAGYLASKYGYVAECAATARDRIQQILGTFEGELLASAGDYLAGDTPGALDAYLPAFLTLIVGVSDEDCPGIAPSMKRAFNTICEDAGIVVPPGLVAHRNRMFEQHLPFPIRI
jgi:hypothetical protein